MERVGHAPSCSQPQLFSPGLATAARLASEGATVVICSRSQANVDGALAHLRGLGHTAVSGVAANINTAAGVAATLAAVAAASATLSRGLDVLVSSAAANPVAGPVLDAPDSAIAKVLDANIAARTLNGEGERQHTTTAP